MTALIFTLCCVLGTAIYVKAVKPFLIPSIEEMKEDINDH